MSPNEIETNSLAQSHPDIFVISSDDALINQLREYIEDYDYNFIGSAHTKDRIKSRIIKLSPNLVLLDSEIEDIDLIKLTKDLERFNIPNVVIVGNRFDEVIDEVLMITPYGYIFKEIEKDELQRTMAVAIRKHELNNAQIAEAKNKIDEKNEELLIEKSDSSFLLILCVALIIMAILSRNATWLQWVLLIPTIAMLINGIASIKKPDPVSYDYEKPFVSVFIPAHNEEATIAMTVRSVCESDYHVDGEPYFEVIVINDGSTDRTGEILHEIKDDLPQLKIVTRKPPVSGKGKGFVLNDALTLSRGEIIGVFDADTKICKDYLTKVVAYVVDPEIDGVQSRVKMYNRDESYLSRMQHVEFASFGNTLRAKDNLGNTGFLGGNGQFVKKQSIIDCGKWDGFAVTEDLNLAVKIMLLGGKIRYCGEAAVYQEALNEWKPFFRQRVRWAIGNFETLFIYLPQILKSKVSIPKKFGIIEHISFYSFNLLIFFGFIITIINAISWLLFHNVTIIRMEAPFIVGILSAISFFPGIMLALSRDKPGIVDFIKDLIKYYIYCFHLIPLFFMTMKTMMTRKERKWAKTEHKGGHE
ncbi:MAG: glycosyltransferase [Methanobrevibacter millerae]|uniref:Glycosyltransferase n=1 Tax=Methanobrevibacter millerae TaxID=230361 RepID=A0A8T3VNP6_9EURY|nr:glycosyltransferase [Methanobrevibacter millerae]MBE6505884.1 glycosyltransferase [Methanobrevibacter millerae]